MNALQKEYAKALEAYEKAQAMVNAVPLPEDDNNDEAWAIAETVLSILYQEIGYTAILNWYNEACAALLNWSKEHALSMITNDEDRHAIEVAYASKSIVTQRKLINLAMRLEA